MNHSPNLNIPFLKEALQEDLKIHPVPPSDSPFTFSSIVTDSRKIKPGCFFVALRGDQFDGHQFIDQAISQGAKGVLCQKRTPIAPQSTAFIFSVEDTLKSYRAIAAAWRGLFSIPVIAVAGSAGKTTTKELLAAILSGKWSNVLKTQGSQNGFIGIPMTLLELQPQHQAAIIEVGIDEIGAMQQHIELVGPQTALLTSIGPEHVVNLRDVPTIAQEEGLALSYVANSGGTVIINLDDPWIAPHQETLKKTSKNSKQVLFSLNPESASTQTPDSNLISGRLSSNGEDLSCQLSPLEHITLPLPLLGRHNALNLLGAVATAVSLGLKPEEIQRGLKNFKGAEGRSEVKHLPRSLTVLCDYYNAQPTSVAAGLELLAQLTQNSPGSPGNWACLGDMLELGPEEEIFHRQLASKIIEYQIQTVLLYGPRMASLADELKVRQYRGSCSHFNNQSELTEALIQGIKPGAFILIKGSRGMKMEEVWKSFEKRQLKA